MDFQPHHLLPLELEQQLFQPLQLELLGLQQQGLRQEL